MMLGSFGVMSSPLVKNWEEKHGPAPLIVVAPLPPPIAGQNYGDKLIIISPLAAVGGERTLAETTCHELRHSEQFRQGMGKDERDIPAMEQDADANDKNCGTTLGYK